MWARRVTKTGTLGAAVTYGVSAASLGATIVVTALNAAAPTPAAESFSPVSDDSRVRVVGSSPAALTLTVPASWGDGVYQVTVSGSGQERTAAVDVRDGVAALPADLVPAEGSARADFERGGEGLDGASLDLEPGLVPQTGVLDEGTGLPLLARGADELPLVVQGVALAGGEHTAQVAYTDEEGQERLVDLPVLVSEGKALLRGLADLPGAGKYHLSIPYEDGTLGADFGLVEKDAPEPASSSDPSAVVTAPEALPSEATADPAEGTSVPSAAPSPSEAGAEQVETPAPVDPSLSESSPSTDPVADATAEATHTASPSAPEASPSETAPSGETAPSEGSPTEAEPSATPSPEATSDASAPVPSPSVSQTSAAPEEQPSAEASAVPTEGATPTVSASPSPSPSMTAPADSPVSSEPSAEPSATSPESASPSVTATPSGASSAPPQSSAAPATSETPRPAEPSETPSSPPSSLPADPTSAPSEAAPPLTPVIPTAPNPDPVPTPAPEVSETPAPLPSDPVPTVPENTVVPTIPSEPTDPGTENGITPDPVPTPSETSEAATSVPSPSEGEQDGAVGEPSASSQAGEPTATPGPSKTGDGAEPAPGAASPAAGSGGGDLPTRYLDRPIEVAPQDGRVSTPAVSSDPEAKNPFRDDSATPVTPYVQGSPLVLDTRDGWAGESGNGRAAAAAAEVNDYTLASVGSYDTVRWMLPLGILSILTSGTVLWLVGRRFS